MKGTPYLYRIENKIRLYVEATGKHPETIILSRWYFDKLRKELTKYTVIPETLPMNIFGIPLVVKARSKEYDYKHVVLLPEIEEVLKE